MVNKKQQAVEASQQKTFDMLTEMQRSLDTGSYEQLLKDFTAHLIQSRHEEISKTEQKLDAALSELKRIRQEEEAKLFQRQAVVQTQYSEERARIERQYLSQLGGLEQRTNDHLSRQRALCEDAIARRTSELMHMLRGERPLSPGWNPAARIAPLRSGTPRRGSPQRSRASTRGPTPRSRTPQRTRTPEPRSPPVQAHEHPSTTPSTSGSQQYLAASSRQQYAAASSSQQYAAAGSRRVDSPPARPASAPRSARPTTPARGTSYEDSVPPLQPANARPPTPQARSATPPRTPQSRHTPHAGATPSRPPAFQDVHRHSGHEGSRMPQESVLGGRSTTYVSHAEPGAPSRGPSRTSSGAPPGQKVAGSEWRDKFPSRQPSQSLDPWQVQRLRDATRTPQEAPASRAASQTSAARAPPAASAPAPGSQAAVREWLLRAQDAGPPSVVGTQDGASNRGGTPSKGRGKAGGTVVRPRRADILKMMASDSEEDS